MSHHSEQYDTNLESFRDSNSNTDRLEREVEAANKKAKTYFEAMKRSSDDANRYRGQYEKLREGLQAIIEKANRDAAKVKVIYLEALLQEDEIGNGFVEGYNAQHK